MAVLIQAVTFFVCTYGVLELVSRYIKNMFLNTVAMTSLPIVAAAIFISIHIDVYITAVPVDITALLAVVAVTLSYFAFNTIWNRYGNSQNLYGYTTLPSAYRYFASPKLSHSTAKISEIIFQDILAFGCILLLLESGVRVEVVALLFLGAAWIVHLPGLWLYGYVFSTTFLLLVVVVAPWFPYIVLATPYALYILFALHVLMYPLRLILLWIITRMFTRTSIIKE